MNNIKQTTKTENENLRTTFKLIVSQLDSTTQYRMIHVWFYFSAVEGKIPRPILVWDLPTAAADLWVVWLRWSGLVRWMGLKLGEGVDLNKDWAVRTQALVHVCWSTQTNMLKELLVKVTVLSLWWNVLTKSNVREESFYLAYNSRPQSIFKGQGKAASQTASHIPSHSQEHPCCLLVCPSNCSLALYSSVPSAQEMVLFTMGWVCLH